MKRLPLILGSIMLLLILLIMISPKTFAPKSPYTISQIRFFMDEDGLNIEAAPYPPSVRFLLGSDSLGRDILSYIIYGTRLTMMLGVLVAFFQFLICIPMALFAGFGNKLFRSIIRQQSIMFSAIPALLISIILLKLDYFGQLSKQNSVIAFVIVLTIVGWPKIGLILMERVEVINSQPFIKGAVAIGKKRKQIALTNVLPHLAPEIIVLFFMEIARNLSMIMQLGIFGIYVGNLKVIKDTQGGIISYYDVSFEPEWASMLASSRTYISVAPWAVLFPALAFFISVLGFNLFGEGLRQLLQEKDSTMMTSFKNIFSFSRYKGYKLSRFKLIIIIILVTVFMFNLNLNEYKVKADESIELVDGNVIIGTKSRDDHVAIIKDYMKELNIIPLEDEDYVYDYNINATYLLENQRFEIISDLDHSSFEASKDYQVIKYCDDINSGFIYNGLMDDLYNIKDYSVFENQFIMLNTKYYNEESLNYFIKDITSKVTIKGVLLMGTEEVKAKVIVEKEEYPILKISPELGSYLEHNQNAEIQVTSGGSEIQPVGKNIVGIYKGKDSHISDEAILIGMNYNHQIDAEVLRFNLSLMKKLTQLDNNKRSLIFMFVDGTIDESYNGIIDVADDFPYSSQKIKAYIDLTGLNYSTFDSIKFSIKQAPLTRAFPWSIAHHLEKELLKESIEIVELETIYINNEYYFTENETDNMMFWDKGIATIIISSDKEKPGNKDIYDLGEILVEVISLNNY